MLLLPLQTEVKSEMLNEANLCVLYTSQKTEMKN